MKKLLLASLISSALIGCGGGGSSSPSNPDQPSNPNAIPVKVVGIDLSGSERLVGVRGGHAGAGFASLALSENNDLEMTTKKVNEDGDIEDIPLDIQPIDPDEQLCIQTIPEINVIELVDLGQDLVFVNADIPEEQRADCSWTYAIKPFIVSKDGTRTYPLESVGVVSVNEIHEHPFTAGVNESKYIIANISMDNPSPEPNEPYILQKTMAISIPDESDNLKITMEELPFYPRYSSYVAPLFNGEAYLVHNEDELNNALIYDDLSEDGYRFIRSGHSDCVDDSAPATRYIGLDGVFIDHEGDFVIGGSECFEDGTNTYHGLYKLEPDSGRGLTLTKKWDIDPSYYGFAGRYGSLMVSSRGKIIDYTNSDSRYPISIGSGEIEPCPSYCNAGGNSLTVMDNFVFSTEQHKNTFTRFDADKYEIVSFDLDEQDGQRYVVNSYDSFTFYPDRVIIQVRNTSTSNKHYVEYNFDTQEFSDLGVIKYEDRVVEEIYPL